MGACCVRKLVVGEELLLLANVAFVVVVGSCVGIGVGEREVAKVDGVAVWMWFVVVVVVGCSCGSCGSVCGCENVVVGIGK